LTADDPGPGAVPGDDLETARLVAAAVSGETGAFDRLVRPYRAAVHRFLRGSCRGPDDAEDLFQDTLGKAWLGLPGYRHRGTFSAWLFRIARNVARDAARRAAARPVLEGRGTAPEPPDPADPLARLAARELGDVVDATLRRLRPDRREVFLLRVHSGLSFQAIAEELGQPLNTVLSHMHRAVNAVRNAVDHHEDL